MTEPSVLAQFIVVARTQLLLQTQADGVSRQQRRESGQRNGPVGVVAVVAVAGPGQSDAPSTRLSEARAPLGDCGGGRMEISGLGWNCRRGRFEGARQAQQRTMKVE